MRGEGVGIGVADVVDADPDGDEGFGGVHGDDWLCVGGPFEDLVFEGDGVVVVQGGADCRVSGLVDFCTY